MAKCSGNIEGVHCFACDVDCGLWYTDCGDCADDQRQIGEVMSMSKVIGYRAGSCRNDDYATSHTYAMTAAGNLWPMCEYGWNRSDGARFSILRGSPGTEGDCKLCRKAVAEGKRPVHRARGHKTKWL